jgi:hypothetical protein
MMEITHKSLRFFRSLLIIASISFLFTGCDNDGGEVIPEPPYSPYLNNGLFVLNEGNFGGGGGSLSFLNLDSLTLSNDIFYSKNQRPLGDVPLSLMLLDSTVWIVVNNSGRIEVAQRQNLASVATVAGMTSPRHMLPLPDGRAYVSDFASPLIHIIDMNSYSLVGSVSVKQSTEALTLARGRVFAACWSNYGFEGHNNNMVLVVDPATNLVVDSVMTGKEPQSMVVDKNEKLWVLCSGGWTGDEFPTLYRINPRSLEAEQIYTFGDINSAPAWLCANGNADSLYFINGGIYAMSVIAADLPDQPLIAPETHLFNSLAVHPKTSEIFVADAIDYQQKGLVLRYRANGTFIAEYRAGIVPGRMVFTAK